jgi:hypothetical protein
MHNVLEELVLLSLLLKKEKPVPYSTPDVPFVTHALPTEWAKPIRNTPSQRLSNPCHFPITFPLITFSATNVGN